MTIAIHETAASASLPDKVRFAHALAESSLLPHSFRSNPANVLVAIELGGALGIAPITAINEINVINGSPALSASLMAALARQAGHKVRVTGNDKSATCTIVRGDDPDFTHEATWDEAKARAAGLWGKNHWNKDAATMLKWRAVSECVRFACSEVLAGLKYTPEELRDSQPTVTVQQLPDEPAAKPVSLSAAIAQKKETAAIYNPDPEPEPAPPRLRTVDQSKKLAVLMRELGMTNRDEALSHFSGLLGRDLDSTKNLTVAEASLVIDHLQKAVEDGADPATGEVFDAEIVPEDGWPTPAAVPA